MFTQEKLTESTNHINSVIKNIDNYIIYQPATYEFTKFFDREKAIEILENYRLSDNYFNIITEYADKPSNHLCKYDNSSLYFSLLWLKKYLIKRKTAILKINSYFIDYTVCQFKNFNICYDSQFNDTLGNITYYGITNLYHISDMLVPETILIADNGNTLTVSDAIYAVEKYIMEIESLDNSTENKQLLRYFKGLYRILLNRNYPQPAKETIYNAYTFLKRNLIQHNKSFIQITDMMCELILKSSSMIYPSDQEVI